MIYVQPFAVSIIIIIIIIIIINQFYCENTLSFCETSKLDSPASLQVLHIK